MIYITILMVKLQVHVSLWISDFKKMSDLGDQKRNKLKGGEPLRLKDVLCDVNNSRKTNCLC